MMMRITNSAIRTTLLIHLVEKLQRGDLVNLLASGVCPQSIEMLRRMSTADVLMLVESGYPDIHFSIDPQGFDHGIHLLARRKEEDEELAYFIQNGTSLSLLNLVFTNISQDKVQTLRSLYKIQRTPGRHSLPPDQIRDQIHQCWSEMPSGQKGESLRRNLLNLHKSFSQFSIDALYATINEFNTRNSSHGKN